MGNDKSFLEKITDTVKDVANLAADAASHALKTEPPRKTDEQMVTYMPLAAEGLISDPMMVPPIAIAPAKRRAPKRGVKKASKKSARKTTRKTSKKPAGKAKKKSVAKKSKQTAKKAAKKSSKKSARKSAKKSAKKARKRTRG
jgi:hypothetical protein